MDVWVRTKTEGANFLRPHIYCLLCSVCGNFSWPHMYPLPEQYMRKLLLTAYLLLTLFCMEKLLLTAYVPLAWTVYEETSSDSILTACSVLYAETSPDRILTACPNRIWGNFSWPHAYPLPVQYVRKLLLTAYLPLALFCMWKLILTAYLPLARTVCEETSPDSISTACSVLYAETSPDRILTACPYSIWGNFSWQHTYRLLCTTGENSTHILTACMYYCTVYIICRNFYRPHSTYSILTASSIGYAETSTYCMLTAIVGHNFC